MAPTSDPYLLPLVRERVSRWERTSLSPRHERYFNIGALLLVAVFLVGWSYAIVVAVEDGRPPQLVSRVMTNPLSTTAPPEAAFLTDALVRQLVPIDELLGASGEVRMVIEEPGAPPAIPMEDLPGDADILYFPAGEPGLPEDTALLAERPARPGIWNVAVRMRGAIRQIPNLQVITPVPLAEARGGVLRGYRIGEWPQHRGLPAAQAAAYAPPKGLVEVTPENMNMPISRHLRLRDFLTKGQENVWPKYVAISPRVLDKFELAMQELEAMGHPVENVFVVSAFRHPHYNVHGGDPRGRGALSRHMYGDAIDFAIDNTGNGCMDDLNGDGVVDVRDAQLVAQAAERVERRFPHLIGGIGIYRPVQGAHCGFVHIDTRGWRARW